MNKSKYLHRKCGQVKKWKVKQNYTKVVVFGDEFPFHLSMRKYHRGRTFYNYGYVDFTPVVRLMKERINDNWDDIYSELVQKTRPKFRWMLDNYLSRWIMEPIFIEHLPYHKKWVRKFTVLLNEYLIDERNMLRFYESEEDAQIDAKRLVRIEKLLKLSEHTHQ